MFYKSSMLYLYCIDPDFVSELTVPSDPQDQKDPVKVEHIFQL